MKKENTTVHKITNYLRHEITYSKLKSGHHLKESSLAKKFEVSRVPVREALRILHSEGYVVCIPNKGNFVKKISTDFIKQTAIVYRLLAPAVLRAAIPHYTNKTYEKADRIIDKIQTCKDFSEVGYLLWDFAKIIYGPSKMKYVLTIFEEIYKHSIRVLNEIFENKGQKDFKITAHKKFIRLCKNNKTNQAIKYWSEFIDEITIIILGRNEK